VSARASAGAALILALLAAATASRAAADPALAQLMQLLAARQHRHETFTEVQQLAMLEGPLSSSGELFYDAPDRLEKRTLKPQPESLLLDHGVLTARRGHHVQVLELAAYPQVVPFVESIRATLAGDQATLERYFTLDFSGDVAQWTLQLKPKDPAVARSVQSITLSGQREALLRVEIRQSDGDRSLMTIGPEISP
jgi:outer membrane lipoprotein-sorting protein